MAAHTITRALVTGASGFIGGWIARTLAERGYSVRALYRREKMPEHLERLRRAGAEVERRDLSLLADVRIALLDVEAVVHAAALASDWGPAELFERQNVKTTVRLLEEAKQAGCRIFVYIGSTSVHGFGPHSQTTEEGPYYPHISHYQRTKKRAEEEVLASNRAGFRTTVLRPADVYGPGDTTTFYRIFEGQQKGVRGTLGGGKQLTSIVYVEDLVEAVALSLENERCAGEVFNITGGEQVSWGELLAYTAVLLSAHPWLELPIPLGWIVAYALTGVYRLLRIRRAPVLTRYRVAHLAYDFDFSIEKARKILGYAPKVAWREGLRRTVEAFLKDKEVHGDP